jgi:hypothetical protein
VIRKSWPAVLLLAIVVLAAAPAAASETVAPRPSAVTHALDYLHAQQASSGGFGDAAMTPWVVMAISAGGENPTLWKSGGHDPIFGYFQNLNLELAAGSSDTQMNVPAFYAKTILAYVAGGRPDLLGAAGSTRINLITKLLSYQNLGEGWFSPYGSTTNAPFARINTTIWAIIAMRAAGINDAHMANAASWLRAQHHSSGGFASQPGGTPDVDDTAAAIQALHAAGVSASDSVMQDAVHFLRSAQRSDGGFPSYLSDGRTYSESTAWAIQAILAVGENPDTWTKGGATPGSCLRRLQTTAGLFNHRSGVTATPIMTTAEAVIALAGKAFPFGFPTRVYTPSYLPRFTAALVPHAHAVFRHTRTVTFKASYADNAGGTGINAKAVRIVVDGHTRKARITSSGLTVTLSGLANGTHTFTVRIVDRAGNATARAQTFTVSVPGSSGSSGGGGEYTPPPAPEPSTPTPTSTLPTPLPSGSSGVPVPGQSTPGTITGTPITPGTTSPTPVPSGSTIGGAAADGRGASAKAGYLGGALLAMLPIGAAFSYLAHRRQVGMLAGAGRGEVLSGGGTAWSRFKRRLFSIFHFVNFPRR